MAFTNVAFVATAPIASLADPSERSLASGENIEAGKLGIIFLVTDNLETTDGATTTHAAITDTSGNTWTKLGEHTSTDGASNDGCTVSLWISEIATALTGGVGVAITFDFSADPGNDGVAIIWKCDYTGTPTLDTVVHAIDANSAVVSGRTSREYMAIGTHGAEGESLTYTEDADYTSIAIDRSTGGGANAVNIYGFAGSRIATLTGDTYGPTPPESLNRVTSLWFLFDDSTGPQSLTGNLFTKAPSFFTGTVTPGAVSLAGSLFTKAPTFFQGSIAQALNGVLFQKAPTFNVGTVTSTYALTGTLFTKAPTFPTGTMVQDQILTGSLFTKAPTFFQGSIAQALNGVLFTKAPTFFTGVLTVPTLVSGVLFQKAPTFPQGAVTTLTALTGTLFQKAPTFFTGTVTPGGVTLTGSLFTKAPTFLAGVLNQQGGPTLLGGTLFQKAPTFPTGTITTGAVSVTGVLFQKAPTFFVGMVGHQLNGVLFQKAPTFFVGELIPDQALTGVLFVKAPTFPQGVVANAGSLLGVLFVKAPTFFVGTLAQVGGSFWRPNPAGYTLNPVAYTANPAAYDPVLAGDLPPWAIEIDGVVFVKAPLFPVGTVS